MIFSTYFLPNEPIKIHFSIWIVHWATTALILILTFSKSSNSYAKLLSNAYEKYLSLSTDSKKIPFSIYSFMLLFPIAPFAFIIIPIFSKFPWFVNFSVTFLAYGYQPLVGTEILISYLCFISRQLYIESSKRIRNFKTKNCSNKLFIELTNTLDDYVKANRFTYNISLFYGPFFVVLFFSFLSRAILYAFMVVNIYKGLSFGPVTWSIELTIIVSLHCIYLITRILYLSYSCHQVEDEVSLYYVLYFTKPS